MKSAEKLTAVLAGALGWLSPPLRAGQVDFLAFLPAEVNGWRRSGVEVFHGRELYRQLDGGAELYLSYGFTELKVFAYEKDGQSIEVNLFEMRDPGGAFGVFSHGRRTVSKQVGQDSQYEAGLLTFWKDRYYISLHSYPETDEKRELILELGLRLAGLVPTEGKTPDLVAELPAEGLLAESVRYLRHPAWVESLCPLLAEGRLHMVPGSEAVLGRYRLGAAKFWLLLLRYPTKRPAAQAEKALRRHLGGEVGQGPGCRFTGLRRHGRRLFLVLDSPDERTARETLAKFPSPGGRR